MGVRYTVNERFFEKWGGEMAYVLGYIYADGNLEYAPKIRGKYFRITSTDEDILPKIRDYMSSQHTISKIEPKPGEKRKPRYFFRIGNAAVYDSLLQHGLYPHKSLSIQLPAVPKEYFGDFVRGYFDGDGCAYIEEANGSFKRLRIIFTSGSRVFLEQLEQNIRAVLMLKKKDIYKSRTAFQLSYSTKDSKALFDLMYKKTYDGLYLGRKYAKFQSVIDLVEKW